MPPRNRVNVDRVRELLAQGIRQKEVCERLGLNAGTVSEIASGKYRPAQETRRTVAATSPQACTAEGP